MTWILTHTKLCTNCSTPIEKNQGCMHMTCWKCKYEFCWLCMGKWSEHGSRTGGYYECNKFQKANADGKLAAEQEQRRTAQQMLDKYAHYYERFANHEKAEKVAISKMPEIHLMIEDLVEKQHWPEVELRFIVEAQEQIIECRRVLKWTYALGYYWEDEAKRPFFEFQQGNLEKHVDTMHEWVEELSDEAGKGLAELKGKLVNMTQIVQTYFTNLLTEFEGGLAAVHLDNSSTKAEIKRDGKWVCPSCTYANNQLDPRYIMCNMKKS